MTATHRAREPGFIDLGRAIRRRWFVVVACASVMVGLAVWVNASQEPTYSATSSFLVEDRSGAVGDLRLQAEVSLLEGDEFQNLVGDRLELAEVPPVESVEFIEGGLVEVTVQAVSPELAAAAANAYTEVFQESRRQRLLDAFERSAAALQTSIDDLENRLVALESDDPLALALTDELGGLTDRRNDVVLQFAMDSGEMAVVTPASPPSGPDGISGAVLLAVAAIIGVLLGGAVSFVLEFVDRTIRTADDVARVVGPVPVHLVPWDGRLRRGPRLHPDLQGGSVEALRDVRAALSDQRTVLFTGVDRRCGTTTVVSNLALLFAVSGRSVVVVDLAVVEPSAYRVFGVSARIGPDAPVHPSTGDGILRTWQGSELPLAGELRIVSVADSPGRVLADVVAGMDIAALLTALQNDFDVVLIDSTAVTVSASCLPAAALADSVMLVQNRRATEHDLDQAWSRLQLVDIDVTGVVVVGSR